MKEGWLVCVEGSYGEGVGSHTLHQFYAKEVGVGGRE